MTTRTNTLIIGGGIAGLACARRLSDKEIDFQLVTENIGGRIKPSKDGKYNYGAMFIAPTLYKHVTHWITLKSKAPKPVIYSFDGKALIPLLKLFRHPIQSAKIKYFVHRFYKHYKLFQKRCEQISQKEALMQDEFLWQLYHQSASEFVHQYCLQDIAKWLINPIIHSELLTSYKEQTAFYFLRAAGFPLVPLYNFYFDFQKMVGPFKTKILIDTVTNIQKEKEGYVVQAKRKTFITKNIVVATPIDISKRLMHDKISDIKKPRNAYTWHVKGVENRQFKQGDIKLFDPKSDVVFIQKFNEDNFIVVSKKSDVNMEKYFSRFEVVKKINWNPIFHIIGNELLDAHLDEGMYLAGDHNIVGLEDAYITGLYAANSILGEVEKGEPSKSW